MPSYEKSSLKLIMEASLGMHAALPWDYHPEEPYTQHAHAHAHNHDQPSDHQTRPQTPVSLDHPEGWKALAQPHAPPPPGRRPGDQHGPAPS